jgi:hypothetical protein
MVSPPSRGVYDYHIDLEPNSQPPKYKVYRMSHAETTELKRQLEEYMKNNWIRASNSPYASPILFARKKNGQLRMCIDYKGLNRITRKSAYPLPQIDTILDILGQSKVWSTIDLSTAFHQLCVHEPYVEKTSFITQYGQFEMRVIPFGLCSAPSSLQRYVNAIFSGHVDKQRPKQNILNEFVNCYMDDIIIFSKDADSHMQHAEE